jgi:endoglycosylceramidase
MRCGKGPTRLLLSLVAVGALSLACVTGPHAGGGGGAGAPGRGIASPTPVGPLGHQGRWLTDATGRVLLLRGINFVPKEAPYYPSAAGFGEDDAAWLEDNGFDAVRLGLTGAGIMPTPGHIDERFLDHLQETVDTLAAHHIYVLLDLHQDGWGERANGEPLGSDGFPEWMTLTGGAANTHTGFPLYYVTNPAIQAAFQGLWDDAPGPDGVPLQAQVATMFGALAQRFGHNPWVLGYDVFNEPWPGTEWSSCLTPPDGCSDLDRRELDPLYAKVTKAVRAHDPDGLVLGEPFVLFNFGSAGTAMARPGGDPASGMSFHMYTVDPAQEPQVVANALDWSTRTGGALLDTEWGATTDPAAITRQADVLDRAMIPWMYWAYDVGVPSGTASPGASFTPAVVPFVARPHPVAVAGTPTAFAYDAAARVLDFSWDATRASGEGRFPPGAVTSISTPAVAYPDGYSVEVTGAKVTSAPCAATLTLTRLPAARTVSVRVTSGGPQRCGTVGLTAG